MKKVVILIIGMIIMSCTARDMELWKINDRQRKERGYKCFESYGGNIYCGYKD